MVRAVRAFVEPLLLGGAFLLLAGTGRAGDLGSITGFDVFAENHPSIAADLAKKPSLVQDPDYLRRHPGLVLYLRSTPLARMELEDEADADVPSPVPERSDAEERTHKHHASMLQRPLAPEGDD